MTEGKTLAINAKYGLRETTTGLRYFHHSDGLVVLQQAVQVIEYNEDKTTSMKTEWVDVPAVYDEEGKP